MLQDSSVGTMKQAKFAAPGSHVVNITLTIITDRIGFHLSALIDVAWKCISVIRDRAPGTRVIAVDVRQWYR